MSDLYFTKRHECVWVEEEEYAYVGLTPYLTKKLGEVSYMDLPDEGDKFSRGDEMAALESDSASVEVRCPIGGEVVELNEKAASHPKMLKKTPDKGGWFIKLRILNLSEVHDLMDESAYLAYAERLN
ncbi:MAG: hypothetical protein ABW189_07955 [Rickettsiales bacterium]